MNFLNRRMFQDGGDANTNPFFYVDQQGQTQYLDQSKLLPILRQTDITALEALIQNPDVTYSPATQEVFRQVVGERKATYSSTDPSLFRFGEFLPDNLTGLSALRDVGGFTGDFAAQIGEGAYNLGRSILSGFGERSADDEPFAPQDIFPSQRFPNVPDTITGRPGSEDGFISGIDESGILRRGYTNPELANILNRALGNVQDFSEEIAEINEQPIEAAPEEISDVLEPNITAGLPEQLPTLTPITSGESAGQLFEPGTVGRAEQDARRLAYEKSIIGKDEFGFPLPESRLLQDETITEALKELQPAELKVDIDRTEADSLMDTQDKFDGKFDPPKITLDKVDTKLTLLDKAREKLQAKPVTDKTKGSFREIFGSDRFLDFIRNVGGELARTGQMGEGLALGAAKAAEERATRDLLAEQEQKKFDRELELIKKAAEAKANEDNVPDIMKPEKILELNNNVKRDITDFRGGLAGVGFVDYAIEIIEDAEATGKPVGGFSGFIASLVDKGFAFAGMGKEFDNLSADSKVAELTKVVKQKNLQAILGESGRTISDKDREIIERVFGDLSVFESVSSVLGKLKESRRGLASSNAERLGNIQTNSAFLGRQGFEGKTFYEKLLPSLESILGIDPFASQSALARATFGGQPIGAESQSITDIIL